MARAICEELIEKGEILKEHEAKDYLAEYRQFYEKYANIGESCDQLPVKVVGCLSLTDNEIPGEILSYSLQYLDSIDCPPGLITEICREVLEDTRKTLMNEASSLTSLSLMRAAVSSVHHCLQAGLDNEKACRLAKPPEAPVSIASASRNGLRCMEDRHVTLDDLSGLIDSQDCEHSSFYAVYDGHSGPLAAAYSAAQLHMNFINSEYYKINPQLALKEAFIKTDSQFGKKQNSGGTTAAVCYLRGNNLLVGWAGDSQALLVGDGSLIQLVNPHKPTREDEHKRIVQLGGQVTFNGIWRVNGILAVSRAIGDTVMKPYVTSDPEFASVKLSGFEEFIVLACDGLWDFVSEDEVALEVYKGIEKYPDDIKKISDQLVKLAKVKGSRDNISVVVVFLQNVHKLSEKAKWLLKKFSTMDASFDNTGGAQTNRFHVTSNQDSPFSKDGLMFDLDAGFKKQNGGDSEADIDPFSRPTNGKGSSNHFEDEMDQDVDDEDLGPETDVDAIDDIVVSPSLAAARALSQGSGADDLDMGAQRRETPNPPEDGEADAEFGAPGLVDNVGESGGEESDEDEWDYFKGGKKEKANIEDSSLPSEERNQETHIESFPDNREDTMSSPLNPEAPPFVPVSPTGNAEGLPQRLLAEEVVAQSPQKPLPMDDISVPEPQEFENEISHRLGDLGNDNEYHNGHSDNSAMSSQENLKETLQGNEKELGGFLLGDGDHIDLQLDNANDAEVSQAEFDRVQKDTTDFCDVQVTYNQQTNQSYDDEGIDEELYERLKNKERDPMSMSFYQEKDLDTCEIGHNPFDMNAVQMVPNDLEEFCNDKPTSDVPAAFDTSNPFLEPQMQTAEVTQHEIHAAISDLDNAVTNESDFMDSIAKAPSPLLFETTDAELPEVKEAHSPVSDNVSQLTEPSEQDIADQHDLLNVDEQDPAVVSQDSAYSADAPSPIPSPLMTNDDICQLEEAKSHIQQSEELFDHVTRDVPLSPPQPVEMHFEFASPPENVENTSEVPTHDPLDMLSQSATDSQIEHSSEFIGQPMSVDIIAPVCLQPHSEEVKQAVDLPNVNDMFDIQDRAEHSPMPANVVDDICQFVQSYVGNEIDKHEDDVAHAIADIQSVPEKLQESNIIDFRNDFVENNVTHETSQTHTADTNVVEDVLSQEVIDKVECLVNTSQEITEDMSKHVEIELAQAKDIIPPANLITDLDQQIVELKSESCETISNNVDMILPVASAVVGAVATAGVITAIVEDKKATTKPKTTAVSKKTTSSKPLTSPTKTSVTKPPTSSTTTKKPLSAPTKPAISAKAAPLSTPKTAPAKPKLAASSLTKAPVPKAASAAPKLKAPTVPKTAAPISEKKPLTNGEIKKEPVKKYVPLSKPAAPKPSVPKTSSTVPNKMSPTAPKSTGFTSAALKPLAAKTPASRPATAPAAPRPKPAPISKAPVTSKPASAVSKTSTTIDKSVKDTTNKQLSARPTPAPRTALAPKTDTKATTKTTTTTTTKPTPAKRPTSATTKTTTTSATKTNKNAVKTVTIKTVKTTTAEEINGTVEKCVKEMEIIINGTDIPLKDDSPQQVDNSLLPIIDAAAD